MDFKNIPGDINAEVLLEYYPEETFDVQMKGLHKRNAYMDILSMEERNGRVHMSLGRNSLYNSLPEFLFHPVDRFDLPQYEKEEKFAEEYRKQEQEKENAYRFFAPIDLALLHVRLNTRHEVQNLTSDNKMLIEILADKLTDEQKSNRFIRQTLQYLPYCKIIRGDKTLITLMLRKVLMEEGIVIETGYREKEFSDESPRYCCEIDSDFPAVYVGSDFNQNTFCYDVHYWNDDECDENFGSFISDLEEYRDFVQDYFLSVESLLEFNVGTDAPALRLSDTTIYNYLNYNTNI